MREDVHELKNISIYQGSCGDTLGTFQGDDGLWSPCRGGDEDQVVRVWNEY